MDVTQLDYSATSMLSQTLAYKSQCIRKYVFSGKYLSSERESSNPVHYWNDDSEKLKAFRKNGSFDYIVCEGLCCQQIY